MTDATGHFNRPGAGATTSASIRIQGLPTNYYWCKNPETARYEVVKVMPPEVPDDAIKDDFDSYDQLCLWFEEEWLSGRLR